MRTPERPSPRVTVVVVTWRAPGPLADCLASLAAQTVPHRLLVVHNDSGDETAAVLAAHPEAEVIHNERNLGFAGGADQGLRAADTEFVAFLNDDARAQEDWLTTLLHTADETPGAGAVTSLLLLDDAGDGGGDETVNNAGVVLLPTSYGADRAAGRPRTEVAEAADVFGFSGGAVLLRRDPAVTVGGFPREFFLYYEDTDLSWRLALAGWQVRYEPRAVVHHRHATSSDVRSRLFAFHNERNRLLMLARCAPAPVAAAAWSRFCFTTASLALRPRRRQGQPHHFRLRVRLEVLTSAVRHLPRTLRDRRTIRGGRLREADVTLGRRDPASP